ncbi:hypothetical protein [Pseudomonas fluorescens]|uniref:hypothetical protein n=1 Tax=Pseudomonas fluorescens TaxID=294 RepID=UPI00123F8F10|nr:hypothetical protein [Pseudomonas fluorescens]VVN47239.1 hypothetical protein PS639_05867 [Pseudomonas fluorescens]
MDLANRRFIALLVLAQSVGLAYFLNGCSVMAVNKGVDKRPDVLDRIGGRAVGGKGDVRELNLKILPPSEVQDFSSSSDGVFRIVVSGGVSENKQNKMRMLVSEYMSKFKINSADVHNQVSKVTIPESSSAVADTSEHYVVEIFGQKIPVPMAEGAPRLENNLDVLPESNMPTVSPNYDIIEQLYGESELDAYDWGGRYLTNRLPIRTGASAPGEAFSPSPEAALTAKADNVIDRLIEGKLKHTVPDRISAYGETAVELVIGVLSSDEEMQARIDSDKKNMHTLIGPVKSETLKVSAEMEATLTGTNFEILPAGPVRRYLSSGEPTVWQWTIKPKDHGTFPLRMTVEAVLTIGNEKTTRLIKTYEDTVYVEANWWAISIAFVKENLAWFWGAIVIGGAKFIWGFFEKKRQDETEKKRTAWLEP